MDRLKLTTDERNRKKDRISARERELDALSNTLKRQERSSAAERDALVKEYQGRINEMMATRDLVATLSESQSNQETSALDSRAHDSGTLRPTVQQNQRNRSHGVLTENMGAYRCVPTMTYQCLVRHYSMGKLHGKLLSAV